MGATADQARLLKILGIRHHLQARTGWTRTTAVTITIITTITITTATMDSNGHLPRLPVSNGPLRRAPLGMITISRIPGITITAATIPGTHLRKTIMSGILRLPLLKTGTMETIGKHRHRRHHQVRAR